MPLCAPHKERAVPSRPDRGGTRTLMPTEQTHGLNLPELNADGPGPGHTIGTTWLVGDVGATNARFGLVSPCGDVLHSSIVACADFAEIGTAIGAYLATRGNL